MNSNKIYSMIGLATRAGKTVSGEFSTEKAVKDYKAMLVIVAADSSNNTKKEFTNMTSYRKIPYFEFGNKEELGHSMGKGERSSMAVTDEGFAKSIIKLLEQSDM